MERLLVECAIRATLIVAGAWLASRLLVRSGASAQHRLWIAALAAMLLLPAWRAWGPLVDAPILEPIALPRALASPASHELATFAPSSAAPAVSVPSTAASAPAPRPWRPEWDSILLSIYLFGASLMLIRLLRGTWRVRSMLRAARSARDGVCFDAAVSAPVVAGWLRPVVLLPEQARDWPAAKWEAVLSHEREHIRRRDPLVQWIALLNRCLFWFHPLAWWLERHLASLAEEACDAAVLARGCQADEYALYLIDIARSVTAGGSRIAAAGAVPFAAGNLPHRIRRIMDGPAAAPPSRTLPAAAFVACACLLALILACSPSRRVLLQTDDMKLSMAEQSRRAAAQSQQRQLDRREGDAALWQAALSLKSDTVGAMETAIKASPEDSIKLLDLVTRFHEARKDWPALDAWTLWFASEHPDTRVDWGHRPEWDRVWDNAGFASVHDVWVRQLAKPWREPFVYMNAAEYLSGSDNQLAEQSLLQGAKQFPKPGLHWEALLARHYAWALLGGAGQPPQAQIMAVAIGGGAAADDAYARGVRQSLLASKDTELLMRTVEQLQSSGLNSAFSQSLMERVLSLEPENRMAHGNHVYLQFAAAEYRAKTDPGHLTDGDRMLLLESQLARGRRSRTDAAIAETTARELLALASRHTDAPSYGAAILLSHLELGEAALRRGDRAEALRDLLAASSAPPAEYTSYQQIDMTLARELVDAGEREAVAKFLDACARFNFDRKALSDWAILLRRGLNPNLFPSRPAIAAP